MSLSPYLNVYVTDSGHDYRVCFEATERVMCVGRKTKHGETFLHLGGPRAARIIEAGRKQFREILRQAREARS